jgi:hypothetical protein
MAKTPATAGTRNRWTRQYDDGEDVAAATGAKTAEAPLQKRRASRFSPPGKERLPAIPRADGGSLIAAVEERPEAFPKPRASPRINLEADFVAGPSASSVLNRRLSSPRSSRAQGALHPLQPPGRPSLRAASPRASQRSGWSLTATDVFAEEREREREEQVGHALACRAAE